MIKKGMFIGERYEIIDKVGSGGMSDVYKAKDHKLGRCVAIKVLKQEFCEDKSFVSKFKIEAQSAAGLAHPNIVNIFDVGEDDGIHYIVMELIEGITLKKYIERKGRLPYKEAVSIAVQVAQGIEAAHNNHIIHRDIKPQNIMISREGKVKVTDFGIARAASANTINSNAMGSVHYISPEQARNGYVDEKSDIYSLGITLYEMITGVVPFEGDSTVTIALQHVQDKIPPMRNYVDVPISIEKIVDKCTQKKPDRRYLKVSSLIADLKKSLVSPDEDFVVLNPTGNTSQLVMISDDEVNVIKQEAGIDNLLDDIDAIEDEGKPDSNIDIEDTNQGEDSEDEFDGKGKKVDKWVTYGSIAAAVVILIVAFIITLKFMNNCGSKKSGNDATSGAEGVTTVNSRYAEVPNVVGKTIDVAETLFKENNLEYKIVEYQFSNTIEKNRVISQNLAGGQTVDKFSTVELVVSSGKEQVEIVSVAGLTEEEAQKKLEDQGFEVKILREANESVAVGTVISTVPVAGVVASYGSLVQIKSSNGTDTVAVVPLVIGLKESEAELQLNNNMLQMIVQYAFSDRYEAGQVIGQDIPAGTEIDTKAANVNTKVTVTVSKGPDFEKTVKFTSIKSDDFNDIPDMTDESKSTAYITTVVTRYNEKNEAIEDTSNEILSSISGYDSKLGSEGALPFLSYNALFGKSLSYTANISDTNVEVSVKFVLHYKVKKAETDTQATSVEQTTTLEGETKDNTGIDDGYERKTAVICTKDGIAYK